MTETVSPIDFHHTALLVMDCQNGLIARLPDADILLTQVCKATTVTRDQGGHVGYVRIGLTDDDLSALPAHSRMASRLAAADRDTIHADSPATAVHDRLAPEPGDITARKTRVGAFSTTDLDRQLRDRDITTLILTGIATSGVVLTTVREAADLDYQLYVLSDATRDPDPATHTFLMENIFPRQAHVLSVAELETRH